MKKKPITMAPLIEDHNEVILLCERIREGLKHGIDEQRIKKYIDWFKEHYLDPHFEIEKTYIFPILGIHNVRVKRALANHRRLNRLFAETNKLNVILNKIEEELSSYIHFEERVLYSEIREMASPAQWAEIVKSHNHLKYSDKEWADRFWESLGD